MREMRMLLLKEDFSGSILVISDLDNDELLKILEQMDEDIENGVGRPTEEVAEELFPNCYYKEIADTSLDTGLYLNDIKCEWVCFHSCYGFSVVQSER